MRQQIERVRKQVTDRLAVDHGFTDEFIENKERVGYRLNPALREVAPGSL